MNTWSRSDIPLQCGISQSFMTISPSKAHFKAMLKAMEYCVFIS